MKKKMILFSCTMLLVASVFWMNACDSQTTETTADNVTLSTNMLPGMVCVFADGLNTNVADASVISSDDHNIFQVVVTDPDANAASVEVFIKSDYDTNGFILTLDRAVTGVFTGTFGFTLGSTDVSGRLISVPMVCPSTNSILSIEYLPADGGATQSDTIDLENLPGAC